MILSGLMLWYGFVPSWPDYFVPLFVVMAVLAGLGPALFLTALNVKYRDLRFVVPFIVQLGSYVSPVGFSSSIVPEKWRFWYHLNPVASVIDGFRWCVLGGEARLDLTGLCTGLIVVALLLWAGIVYFRKTERSFADLI